MTRETQKEGQGLGKDKVNFKARKKKLSLLRFRGDHLHNLKVIKKKKGRMILGRRFRAGEFNLVEYGPCPKCLQWMKLRLLSRHDCPGKSGPKEKRGTILTESMVLAGRVTPEASQGLRKEVYSVMLQDEVGMLARRDPLITALGNNWLMRNAGNRLMRGSYTSSIMRLVAKMLLYLQKMDKKERSKERPQVEDVESRVSEEKLMSDFIRPQFFDRCVQAALEASYQAMDDDEDLRSPSNAIKLGYELKRLCNLKSGMAIRQRDVAVKEECRDFMDLMRNEWGTKVTKLARIKLAERQYSKKQQLPLPADLVTLRHYLMRKLAVFDTTDCSIANFREAVELAETKLLTYNRRRSGEIQALRLDSYERRIKGTSDVDEELTRELTDMERHLLDSQEVIVVRGKTGRGVPVLIPQECCEILEYLTSSEVRKEIGIHPHNPYVFAASRGLGVVRAYSSLTTICKKANLKKPEMVTSVTLRKYMATVTQVLDLNHAELDWVCEHLGHTLDVHKTHYRQRSDVLERIEVAKILLLQDTGKVHDYIGKNLQEIQFQDIVYGEDPETIEEVEQPTTNEFSEVDRSGDTGDTKSDVPLLFDIINDDDDDDDIDECTDKVTKGTVNSSIGMKKSTRKKAELQTPRHKWTTEEEEELTIYFKQFFKTRTCPRDKDCKRAISISRNKGGTICNQKAANIKKKVNNMIQKLK